MHEIAAKASECAMRELMQRDTSAKTLEEIVVGAEPDKTQCFGVGFGVDQQQIGFEVAFAMIVPLSR